MLRESRRFAHAASTSLHVANWVVLGHGTNVTRVTRGENIFNNKIYIGNLASIRCEVFGSEVPWRVPRGTHHNISNDVTHGPVNREVKRYLLRYRTINN